MQLNHETVTLLDGTEIVVSEADFPASNKMEQMKQEAKEKPVENSILQSFRTGYYPVLAASLSGEPPTLEEAFKMLEVNPEGIDNWYRAVRRLNPDWWGYEELDEKLEKIKFRDGLQLTVKDYRLPSIWYRIVILETKKLENEDPRQLSFARAVYPKLAGVSVGDVPTEEEAYHFPSRELSKWFDTVDRVNPTLFKPVKEAAAEAQTTKKKEPSA